MFLFLWFLENNRILYRPSPDGSRLSDNNTQVALTPMIAESRIINLKLDEAILRRIDDEYDAMAAEAEEYAIDRSKRELGRIDSILGAAETVGSLCEDIVAHYEENRQ